MSTDDLLMEACHLQRLCSGRVNDRSSHEPSPRGAAFCDVDAHSRRKGRRKHRLTRVDAIKLELLIDIGLLLLDVGRAIDGGGSHDAKCDAAITGVSNAAIKIQAQE